MFESKGSTQKFKHLMGGKTMSAIIEGYNPEHNRFTSISDFKMCMLQGGEVEICVGERTFGIFARLCKTPESPEQILVCEKYIDHSEDTDFWCDTADEALEFRIGGVRLRDIITEVEVSERTI
ncbi:MAG: hypothetical protein QM689_12415 [Oscillospiraceae bacterium]